MLELVRVCGQTLCGVEVRCMAIPSSPSYRGVNTLGHDPKQSCSWITTACTGFIRVP